MQLDDLNFASDLTFLSQTHQQMQVKTKGVATAEEQLELKTTVNQYQIDDGRFSHTLGSSMMPYGTAKDCFSSTVCPQVRSLIFIN
ncbi:unnamed protein product [Schistosoma mattheei]|uniref:Uncharacterized protein n=1 Tax=Schistosoma mattheei TaxID=31246 RepID=A0A183NS11_9TREM|nr:unnamed protein product [Schistosoma mattheei]